MSEENSAPVAGGEPIDRLVQDLLDTGEMNPETIAELERLRADHREGNLHPDDRDYLVALHGRLLGGDAGVPSPSVAAAPDAEVVAVAEGWRERAEAAEVRLEAAQQRLGALLAEARHLEGTDAVARVAALTEALAIVEGVPNTPNETEPAV